MNIIYLNEKDALNYIENIIRNSFDRPVYIDDCIAKYHHVSHYELGKSIIDNGIISLKEQSKLGLKKISDEQLEVMNDIESHVNGNDGISLSVVGLNDIYPNEDEYDPYNKYYLDFLINNEVKASRNSMHYGNEFICYHNILPNMIESVDIRLLEYIICAENKNDIHDIIDKYNYLIDISLSLKNKNILLRECSLKNTKLDKNKLINAPKIALKK